VLLTAGFSAAILLQHLFSWAVRMGAQVHMWGWVWASGAVAWCVARSFEIGTFPLDPDLAARWQAVSVVALLPVVAGLLGVVGTTRRLVLPKHFGAWAAVVCLGGAVLLVTVANFSPPSLFIRVGMGGASFVLADPGPVKLGLSLVALSGVLLALVALLRRLPLDLYLCVLVLVGAVCWTAAVANDLLMGAGLVATAPLSSHGLLILGLVLTVLVGTDSGMRPEELAQVMDGHRRRVDEQNSLLARALADARDAGQARQRFLARMSHELRTPLSGVLGMTELALDSDLDETQRRYLLQAHASAEALLILVDDLLDLARLEDGRLSLADEPFKLRPCLEDSLRMVGAQAAPKGLELVLDAPADLPRKLVGDPVRLRQVLVNLLGNAVKFTERGQVVLRARATTEYQGRLGVRFVVQDTGPGIPVEEQSAILQPFVQGAAGEGRGTGLGLAICTELVRRMGGVLEVDSTVGEGSAFSFVLRLGLPDADDEITHLDPVLLAGLPVLLAEDNADVAQAIVRELDAWRIDVTVAEDGSKALAALDQARAAGRTYPLLLLDSDMPEVDGWDVLRTLALHPGQVGATVFMLPAGAPADQYRRSRALGVNATIAKPVRAAELMEAVLAAVGCSMSNPSIDTDPTTDPGGRVRVLVADDHAVNRELVSALLSAHGAQVHVVEDGREAVQAVEEGRYELVLMDVRMPHVDGPEATRQIRAAEAASGRPRVPIVALTAHAMAGDRERLLGQGMDGYLTKPLDRQALLDMLNRYRLGPFAPSPDLDPADPGAVVEQPVQDLVPVLVLDPAGAIDRVRLDQLTGGDDDLAADLGRLMLAEIPIHRQHLETALADEDAAGVARAAHALCGAAGNIGAVDLRASAMTVEAAGRDQDIDLAATNWPMLRAELSRLEDALERMLVED